MRDGCCRENCGAGWLSSVGWFVAGLVALAVAELVLLIYVFAKLLSLSHKKQKKKKKQQQNPPPAVGVHTCATSIGFDLQGNVWVAPLPQGDWSKLTLKQPSSKDKKKEKEAAPAKDASKTQGLPDCCSLEIWPVRKHAVLKSNILYLTAADGTEESIPLEGCDVLAVSSGHGPGGKWARKMPLKVHHDERVVYHGCNDCLLYFDTGWEKETWCEVLRATTKLGSSLSNDWFLKTKREYQDYTQRVETHLPYVNKFHAAAAAGGGGGGAADVNKFGAETKTEEKMEENKAEEGLSRTKLIWKKLTRRSSKGKETKDIKSVDALEALADFTRRISAASAQGQDDGSSSSRKTEDVSSSIDAKRNISTTTSSRDENENHGVNASSAESESQDSMEAALVDNEGEKKKTLVGSQKDEKDASFVATLEQRGEPAVKLPKEIDQGLLCLNMIIGRLYFDFYHSPTRVASIQRLIQKQLSKMKTPSYIKSITIAELDLGKSPPYATALRMLPADTVGALALEFDLQWRGVGSITCETRLEVRDASAQEKVASQVGEPGLAGDAAAALLTGIGNDLNIAGDTTAASVVTADPISSRTGIARALEGGNKKGGLMQSVKSIISRVAEQVSQVPLVLKIRCESFKGMGLLRLRAPPTDRIWFSFKEMPELDLVPEPCIGERRINSGPLGTFIVQHLKMQLRETLVMPNCEDLFTAWMMAEKDDWLPQSAIPVAFTSAQASESEKQNLRSSNTGSQAKPNNSDKPQSIQQHALVVSAALKTDVLPPSDSNNNNHHQHRRSVSMTRLPNEVPKGGLQPAAQAAAAPSTVSPTMSRFSHDVANGPQPARPSGVTMPVSAPSSAREETDIKFSKAPLLDRGESRASLSERAFEAGLLSRGESRAFSGRDFEVGSASDRTEQRVGAIASFSSQRSEGSVSDSDVQYLASHNGERDLDLQQKMQSSSSRSSKMIFLGKMGAKLDEKRRLVLEKLRERKVNAIGGDSAHT